MPFDVPQARQHTAEDKDAIYEAIRKQEAKNPYAFRGKGAKDIAKALAPSLYPDIDFKTANSRNNKTIRRLADFIMTNKDFKVFRLSEETTPVTY